MFAKTIKYTIMFVILGTVCVPNSWAYIDPGTGSMLVQAAIATIAAIAVGVRYYWRYIRSFFLKRPNEDAKSE
jgi:hypothetical protein